jgi:hypothetical protein
VQRREFISLLGGENDRLPALMAGLVRRRVAVIATAGDPPTLAAAVQRSPTTCCVLSFDWQRRSGRQRPRLDSERSRSGPMYQRLHRIRSFMIPDGWSVPETEAEIRGPARCPPSRC